jgi:hypothetical protein
MDWKRVTPKHIMLKPSPRTTVPLRERAHLCTGFFLTHESGCTEVVRFETFQTCRCGGRRGRRPPKESVLYAFT